MVQIVWKAYKLKIDRNNFVKFYGLKKFQFCIVCESKFWCQILESATTLVVNSDQQYSKQVHTYGHTGTF